MGNHSAQEVATALIDRSQETDTAIFHPFDDEDAAAVIEAGVVWVCDFTGLPQGFVITHRELAIV